MGSATQAPFISCSEVHNIKGHALMIRYPGNSKARRENYTYPTSNILAKMKVISVELGREIKLWIYQCVRVLFFFPIVRVDLLFWRWWCEHKGNKRALCDLCFPKKAVRVGRWQSVRPRHHCVDVPGASAGVTAQCGPPLSGENWNSAAAESKLHSRNKNKSVLLWMFSRIFFSYNRWKDIKMDGSWGEKKSFTMFGFSPTVSH